MSAGNLFGTVIVTGLSIPLWIMGGWVINAFVEMLNAGPVFQAAVNGMNMLQIIYNAVLVIFWIVMWLRFAIVEHNESNTVV